MFYFETNHEKSSGNEVKLLDIKEALSKISSSHTTLKKQFEKNQALKQLAFCPLYYLGVSRINTPNMNSRWHQKFEKRKSSAQYNRILGTIKRLAHYRFAAIDHQNKNLSAFL